MERKIIAIALTIVMSSTLISCNRAEDTDKKTDKETVTTTAATQSEDDSSSESETTVVTVTSEDGSAVTEKSGKPVTEVVTVKAVSGSATGKSEAATSGEKKTSTTKKSSATTKKSTTTTTTKKSTTTTTKKTTTTTTTKASETTTTADVKVYWTQADANRLLSELKSYAESKGLFWDTSLNFDNASHNLGSSLIPGYSYRETLADAKEIVDIVKAQKDNELVLGRIYFIVRDEDYAPFGEEGYGYNFSVVYI